MIRIFTLLFTFSCCLSTFCFGQSFSVDDTIKYTAREYNTISNKIANNTSGSIYVRWKVVATNFPADWFRDDSGRQLVQLCDNRYCRELTTLWPANGTELSGVYAPGEARFDMMINLALAKTSGTFYLTVRYYNNANRDDSATTTWLVSKMPNDLATVTKATEDDVTLYPNPAYNEVNVTYPVLLDIKNISIFNNIGKISAVYKVAGSSANLNLESLQAGIYFARLYNSMGDLK
jgi:hypothetical protein